MIRLTWGAQKYLDIVNASLFFVVGRYPNLKIETRLEQEARRYKDILQGSILEDYFLLGLKSLSWIHWTKQKCSKVPWIVKTDDDMVNNIIKMGDLVNAVKHQKNTITCSTKTEKVLREKTGTRIDKWVIPFDEWDEEYFPTNCWGVVYIFSSHVRDKLLEVYEKSNGGIFRIDDVFITGILASMANVTHRDISDVISFYEGWDEDVMLTGNVWFGHIPPDNEALHKRRYWLWKRMEKNL
ncbi:beta-1,3-galactosyltransferase 2 [Eurytemora carolleeae]|uniref:beta-1,3-galactosyltransferase 2 n=1 Tax=Eurytemora carolleeae TaxID=1294199 RepID=UPI000C78BAC8|nr:beta-1,3-galactosyltransferase 2 [Eurytemora carolleeae]|eukprot:XP_023322211.1 beta-1,3-galactosyltransferase 2-like [Eurytemora affinis]